MIVPRVSDSDFGTTPDLRRPIGKPRFGHYCHSREDHTVPVLLAMHAGGADVFDVRVPFSSPIAAFKKLSLRALDYATMLGTMALGSWYLYSIIHPYPKLHTAKTRRQGTCDAGANAFVMEDLQPEEASDFRRNQHPCAGFLFRVKFAFMQARHYWGTHVASLRWGPLSLLLKGSWPAKLSIPSFVSAIHFDAVVVESRIVSLREPVQFLTRTSKTYFAEGVINYADRAQIWLERGDPQQPYRVISNQSRS
ncbi:hypothetical protein BKA82DRAFT_30712 [Pisolithus tinctorius]|nr:hypothetical protein BKA82DRAFT_30712 [Pisolithus tinctorius]